MIQISLNSQGIFFIASFYIKVNVGISFIRVQEKGGKNNMGSKELKIQDNVKNQSPMLFR